ncbi:LuxR C-terminal-related transcriptional regulator [Streptomyces sp. NPDC008240]|uniref:helix-turn-helix transcriptional regulator n=1 Tax=Streptomyces sp. NPDC008240 TaxID=3364822 RepID=UPI0036E07CC3
MPGVKSRLSAETVIVRCMAHDVQDGDLSAARSTLPADRSDVGISDTVDAEGPASAEPDGTALASHGVPALARRLFGRAAQVEKLVAALADVRSGRGRAIALAGEPGIGKSALMWTVAAHARATGIQVLAKHVQGSDAPFLPDSLDMPARGDSNRSAAQQTPAPALLAAVDDLHQLPGDQIADAERLIEAAAVSPLLCLMAYRQRQLSPALASVLSRAASAGLLEVWNLGPLSQEEAEELLRDHPDVKDVDEVRHEAMGNPQYLKVLATNGEASTDAGMAILGELAGLDRTTLTTVQAAAVIGERFHPELLAAVAGLAMPVTMRALDTLTRLDLVRPVEPAPQLSLRHRAVGDVVYHRLEPTERFVLHQRAERALAERAAPITQRAHHIARAADPSQPEHVTTLIAAARDSLHTSPRVAASHLRTALSLINEGEPHWHEAQVLFARTRLLTGDASESRALLDALRSAIPGQPPRDASAIADSSRLERRLGHYSEAGAIARSGLEALADNDTATAAALHTELADYAYDRQDYRTSREHAETAAEIARRHHDRAGEAKALAQAAVAHLFTADQTAAQTTATRAAEIIDAASDAALLANLEATHQLGMTEGMLGRLADAERHLERGAALSRRTGQTYMQREILSTLANTQLRSGNLRRALVTLDETARHVEGLGGPAAQAIIAMVRAEILFWLNSPSDLQEVLALAERAETLASTSPFAWAVSVRCFHAEFVLLTGDAARARWLLVDAAGGPELPRLTTWRKPRWCDTLAQAALAEGDHVSAEHWARLAEVSYEQLPSTGRRGFPLRARMRAHALNGDTDRAVKCAHDAIADFSAGGQRIETCRTLLAAADVSRAAGRTDDMDGLLGRAADLAQQCDSARLAAEVDDRRGRASTLPGSPGADDALAVLTGREREIAGLVSTGLTNQEIAATLFLSVRTVESHLARIYRKLDVPNRASLTRTMLNAV